MAGARDKQAAFLRHAAKTRIRRQTEGLGNMRRKTFKSPPMKNANVNTKPDVPAKTPVTANNQIGKAWYKGTPGNIANGPRSFNHVQEAPQDNLRMRHMSQRKS